MIVAIGRGGVVPGNLMKQKMNVDLNILGLQYRNDNHEIINNEPQSTQPIDFEFKNKRLLIVDDVSRSGETLKKAKALLKGAKNIKTMVVNGKADYSLYDEECFKMPWSSEIT
ncbi:phosphoribosyltransferase [Patescibacteria group bacterium]|nr:phosphoribosyltransferase [Patescibacteria group bacterium]